MMKKALLIFLLIITVVIIIMVIANLYITRPSGTSRNIIPVPNSSVQITKELTTEMFQDPTQPCPESCRIPASSGPLFKSLVNINSGYAVDIEPTNQTDNYFLIHYSDNDMVPDGVFAVNSDNQLFIQIMNESLTSQIWRINKIGEELCVITLKDDICNSRESCIGKKVLTFDNTMSGFVLSYRPYNGYDTQHWRLSTDSSPYSKGIRVSRGSLAPVESKSIELADIEKLALDKENTTKLQSVLDLISKNLTEYKSTAEKEGTAPALGTSALSPLKVNISFTGDKSLLTKKESFQDKSNVVELLNQYEYNASKINAPVKTLLSSIDSVASCPVFDAKDYTLNRIGQCNCNLSDLQGYLGS